MPTTTIPSMTATQVLKTARSQISYEEDVEGHAERYVDGGTEVTRRLRCYWRDRQQFILDMVGDVRIVGTAGQTGAKIRRDLPEKHPDYDDNTGQLFSMWANEMTYVGHAGWQGRSTYPANHSAFAVHSTIPSGTWPAVPTFRDDPANRGMDDLGLAVYDVVYRPTLHYMYTDAEIDSNSVTGERARYVVVTHEPGGENVTLPKGLLKFENDYDSNTYNELAPVLFPTDVITYTWLMVPVSAFRPTTILGDFTSSTNKLVPGVVGSVNSLPFDGFPAETLLCLPPTLTKYIHANTGVFLNIAYHFQFRPQTHQRYMRNDDTFRRLVRVQQASPPPNPKKGVFESVDFAKLFDVSQT